MLLILVWIIGKWILSFFRNLCKYVLDRRKVLSNKILAILIDEDISDTLVVNLLPSFTLVVRMRQGIIDLSNHLVIQAYS